MSFARLMAVGSMSAALLACGGAVNQNEQRFDSEGGQMQQQTVAAEPLGTFKAEAPNAGDLVNLVLMSDGRFHAEQVVVCIAAPCDPAPIDGTYERVSNNFSRQLKLFNDAKELVASYQYAYDGNGVLNVRGEGEWQAMAQAEQAWCAQVSDCPVQGLLTPACEGNWHCHPNGCMFHVVSEEQPVTY